MELVSQCFQVIKRFLVLVIRQFADNRCTENAAALTYTTLFAVVPMMTVTYSMLSAIPSLSGVGETVQNFIFSNFVPATGEVVQSYLQDFSQQARKLTLVGVVFLLVTSFMMLKTIDKALNTIWQVNKVRRGVSGFLLYWAILSLGPILLGAGFLLSSYLASVKFISDTTAFIGGETLVLRLMPLVLSSMVLFLLFSAVPNRRVPFAHALAGAFVSALLVELAKAGFALFIASSPSYQLVYGAFAAVPLFLLWIYLSWNIVLLGAVVVRALGIFSDQKRGQTLPPLISTLIVLQALQNAFRQGQGLTFVSFNQCSDQKEWRLGLQEWEEHSSRLTDLGLLGKNDLGEYILVQDLREVNLAALVSRLPWALPEAIELDALTGSDRPGWFLVLSEQLNALDHRRKEVLDYPLDSLFAGRA